jgi:hypothetical protein
MPVYSPLFTKRMYEDLGTQWASSIPAFLSLACAPMPFLFLRWGKSLRDRSKLATEARRILEQMTEEQSPMQTSSQTTLQSGSENGEPNKQAYGGTEKQTNTLEG